MGDKFSSRHARAARPLGDAHLVGNGVSHPGPAEGCGRCAKNAARKARSRGRGKLAVSRRAWGAIVRFFRAEERCLVEGFGILPDRRKTFEANFRKDLPQDWKRYVEARRAIESVRRGKR